MIHKVEMELGGRTLSLEVGRVAKQADGAVWVQYADTAVLATAVASKKVDPEIDFFPLFVEYREKAYAAGRIPGNIFKREGRPLDKEILSARLIDHQLRPMFPEELKSEVQMITTVLSSDQENDADVLGMIGSSAALSVSDIPFLGPLGAVRVGRVGGGLILNPTFSELDNSDLDIIVSGTADTIVSVEGSAREVPEADLLEALQFGHAAVQEIVALQRELARLCGAPKRTLPPKERNEALVEAVREISEEEIRAANRTQDKEERQGILDRIQEETLSALAERFPECEREIEDILLELEKRDMRAMVVKERRRIDGRGFEEVRSITCEVGVIPRGHGSALFARGQTQSLCVTALGSKMDERLVDDLEGKSFKNYMVDYNFPPFSVGETKPIRGPSRRDIGHGHLAEQAIEPVIPSEEIFPYTIRVVSEILESDSSSSMATVCAGSLSLMDAGVKIKSSVAGIGVGLVKEEEDVALLTDILGMEDHLGDMDLKVAGTRQGITAVQMDIKIAGITFDIMKAGLERAREGRLKILEIMDQTLVEPRKELSPYAPRIISLKIDPSKIGIVIGPGGKMIREIEETGAKVSVEDDGTITIASVDSEAGEEARRMVENLVEDAEIGKIYTGKVKRIMNFGAFVEILPGKEGLVHISELERRRVNRVEDVLQEGDEVLVKVIGIDDQGKIKLSKKAAMAGGLETRANGVERLKRSSR